MAKKNKRSAQEKLEKDHAVPAGHAERKVLMRFSEHKYYNDINKPIYESGKIYELEGAAWIQRWMKRGGEIVEDVKAKPGAVAHIPPPEEANPVPVESMAVVEKDAEEEVPSEEPVVRDFFDERDDQE